MGVTPNPAGGNDSLWTPRDDTLLSFYCVCGMKKTVAFFNEMCYTKTVCEQNLTTIRGGVFLKSNQPVSAQFEQLTALVGNTPLLEITLKYRGELRRVYAKAEYYNLSGSIKDRVAYYILKKAYETGAIRKGDYIAEATSGNTGIAFSAMGAALGNPVVIYMPDWMSTERRNLIRSYGAEVRLVSAEQGGFLGSIAMSEDFGKQNGVFLPRQFSNEDNAEAHFETTGAEIIDQLAKIGKVADAVVAGVGTGGTVSGTGAAIKKHFPNAYVVAVEPATSAVLSGNPSGPHKIQGIGAGFVPKNFNRTVVDEILPVGNDEALATGRALAKEEGLLVGISSGAAAYAASVLAQRPEFAGKNIVVLLPDTGERYLSTALFSE